VKLSLKRYFTDIFTQIKVNKDIIYHDKFR